MVVIVTLAPFTSSRHDEDKRMKDVVTQSARMCVCVRCFRYQWTPGKCIASHSQEWSISNFSCCLTRNITSHSMENLAFPSYSDGKMITTNSHYLTYTIKSLGECTFWTVESISLHGVVHTSKFSLTGFPWHVYFLVWTEKYALKFFLDKSPCWKASMPAFQQGDLSRKNLPFFPSTQANKTCQGETLLVWTTLKTGSPLVKATSDQPSAIACLLRPHAWGDFLVCSSCRGFFQSSHKMRHGEEDYKHQVRVFIELISPLLR